MSIFSRASAALVHIRARRRRLIRSRATLVDQLAVLNAIGSPTAEETARIAEIEIELA